MSSALVFIKNETTKEAVWVSEDNPVPVVLQGSDAATSSSLSNPAPVTSVGPNETSRLLSAAASVNATLVKNSAGVVYRVSGYNANAAARYLKLYDKATAPTVGTDTPFWTEYLAPQSKFTVDLPSGLYFDLGIGYGLTTGGADNDTGALTAGDILALNLAYR